MSEPERLIPSPPVLRERLARCIREERLLRALLRLSMQAAAEEQIQAPRSPRHEADGRGGAA